MDKKEFIRKYKMRELSRKDGFEIEIMYATKENFTKRIMYNEPICMLREKTAKKLIEANKILNQKGFKIKIWDSFRPIISQERMWEVYPDETFVAHPKKGKCNHCKGIAVDVTLCTLEGKEVKMPTEFDHFGIESYRNYYNKLDEETKANVMVLEKIMEKCGFVGSEHEWWHFCDNEDDDVINDSF